MKVSLNQQIDEVQRELEMRRSVYPSMIASRRIRASVAEYQTQRLQAVLNTLLWLKKHEIQIRAFVGIDAAKELDDEHNGQRVA